MNETQWWKNFSLGQELSVAGTFIYDGLRGFYELDQLDFADDIFEVLYHLSVGIERLMKIAIILLEHDGTADQEAFEKSLTTHNHCSAARRPISTTSAERRPGCRCTTFPTAGRPSTGASQPAHSDG